MELFLDLDISILGAPEEKYNAYAKQIRKEYSSYSWEEYCRGRTKVMTSFLQRDRIFLTDHFHATYEEQARNNIQRELNSLQNGDEDVYPGI
jgi:predicted metal-dependent HD superfamily phosphohydrolase